MRDFFSYSTFSSPRPRPPYYTIGRMTLFAKIVIRERILMPSGAIASSRNSKTYLLFEIFQNSFWFLSYFTTTKSVRRDDAGLSRIFEENHFFANNSRTARAIEKRRTWADAYRRGASFL